MMAKLIVGKTPHIPHITDCRKFSTSSLINIIRSILVFFCDTNQNWLWNVMHGVFFFIQMLEIQREMNQAKYVHKC